MSDYRDIKELVEDKSLHDRIASAEDAAKLIEPGMTIGCSGFTPSGYPKVVPMALAKRAEAEGPIPVTIWSGASAGPELDSELCRAKCMVRRFPYQTNDVLRKGINSGDVQFADIHLSHCAQNLPTDFTGICRLRSLKRWGLRKTERSF